MCKAYYTGQARFGLGGWGLSKAYNADILQLFPLTDRLGGTYYGINILTYMPDPAPATRKRQALQACGTFNPRHARVRHRLFQDSEFFDPQDLLQLKYESLRALQQDDYSLAQAASEFGLSRPTLYQAQAHFQAQGLEGLLPGKRGPKGAHKLTPQLLEQLRQWRAAEPALSARQLAQRVRQRFKLKVHPRTLEKALQPKAKRGRLKS
jgi:transposase